MTFVEIQFLKVLGFNQNRSRHRRQAFTESEKFSRRSYKTRFTTVLLPKFKFDLSYEYILKTVLV